MNGEDVCGKSQSDVVAMLRTTPLGSTVSLVVSRIMQEDEKFPRELVSSSICVASNENLGFYGSRCGNRHYQDNYGSFMLSSASPKIYCV